MNFEGYKNKMKYPKRPIKPLAPKGGTSDDFREYADRLKEWEDSRERFLALKNEYDLETQRLEEKFKVNALCEVGLIKKGIYHNLAHKAFDFAWDHGHSSGLESVYEWLEDIAGVIID